MTSNGTKQYGVEVRHKEGGVYTTYVFALNVEHAREQVQPGLEHDAYISDVYVNTPKPKLRPTRG